MEHTSVLRFGIAPFDGDGVLEKAGVAATSGAASIRIDQKLTFMPAEKYRPITS